MYVTNQCTSNWNEFQEETAGLDFIGFPAVVSVRFHSCIASNKPHWPLVSIMRSEQYEVVGALIIIIKLMVSTYTVVSLASIENVQRSFSKRLPSLSSYSYFERLAFLNLEPLELRRLRFDLLYYCKVFHNLTPFAPNEVYNVEPSRSTSPYLLKPAKASYALPSSFVCRYFDAWNSLPSSLRHAFFIADFKKGVENIDLTKFLQN
jgi:hypothetical protein